MNRGEITPKTLVLTSFELITPHLSFLGIFGIPEADPRSRSSPRSNSSFGMKRMFGKTHMSELLHIAMAEGLSCNCLAMV